MFRAIPIGNKLCYDKEIKRSWRIHQQKLKNLKPKANHVQPNQWARHRPKKITLQNPRHIEIDRENEILSRKIWEITSKGTGPKGTGTLQKVNKAISARCPSHTAPRLGQQGFSRGTIQKDNSDIVGREQQGSYCKQNSRIVFKENSSISTINPKSTIKSSSRGVFKSTNGRNSQYLVSPRKGTLNEPKRKKDLMRIVEENQEIIKRIEDKKSIYNRKKMQKDRIRVQKNISLISQYPYKNYPHFKTPVNLWMTSTRTNRMKGPSLVYNGTQCINSQYYVVNTQINKGNFIISLESLEDMNSKYKINLLSMAFGNKLNKLLNNLQIDKNKHSCSLNYTIGPFLTQ